MNKKVKTATPEEYFLWESDVEGEAGYNTIIGYRENIQTLLKIKIPSRCKILKPVGNASDHSGGRSFIQNKQDIELSNTITEIGYYAFINCQNLKNITIPNSVIEIEDGAFMECSGLTDITIADSVTTIEGGAFYNVPHIYYNGTATGSPWGALAIN